MSNFKRYDYIIALMVLAVFVFITIIGFFFHNIFINFQINKVEDCQKQIVELNNIILIQKKEPMDILTIDIKKYISGNYPTIPSILSEEMAKQIVRLSFEEKISPELIVAIIQVESSFNPMAISNKNARGLMQVMPMWAKEFKLKKVCELHNIDTGIRIGIKVLKIHIQEQNGDLSEGLYYYVNKDRSYVENVYKAMGEFVLFLNRNKGDVDDSNDTTINRDTGIDKINKG